MSEAAAAGAAPPDAEGSGFGPTLPQLIAPRWRAMARWQRALALLAAAAVGAAGVGYYLSRQSSIEHFAYRGPAAPGFKLRYEDGALNSLHPRGRELLRLESSRGGVLAQRFVITPLRIRPRPGNLFGRLPLDARGYLERAAGRYRGYRPVLEGRTRLNGVEAYQLVFTARYLPRHGVERELFGKIVLLPEDLDRPRRGIALEMLATTLSPVRAPLGVGNISYLKKPYRTLRYLD